MSRYLKNLGMSLIALACVAIGSTIAVSNIATTANGEAFVTKVNFDQTFADIEAAPRPGNTAANREKLREAGWKRIMVLQSSKKAIAV